MGSFVIPRELVILFKSFYWLSLTISITHRFSQEPREKTASLALHGSCNLLQSSSKLSPRPGASLLPSVQDLLLGYHGFSLRPRQQELQKLGFLYVQEGRQSTLSLPLHLCTWRPPQNLRDGPMWHRCWPSPQKCRINKHVSFHPTPSPPPPSNTHFRSHNLYSSVQNAKSSSW